MRVSGRNGWAPSLIISIGCHLRALLCAGLPVMALLLLRASFHLGDGQSRLRLQPAEENLFAVPSVAPPVEYLRAIAWGGLWPMEFHSSHTGQD